MQQVTILGAGIAGLAAGYHLLKNNIPTTIYEQNSYGGGLCHSFTVNKGFQFDTFVHVSFAKEPYVRDFLARSVDDEFLEHTAMPYNLQGTAWLKHPLHNNLYQLPIKERIAILSSFMHKKQHLPQQGDSYAQWLDYHYGEYFAKRYPKRYTRKYWCIEAEDMGIEWIGHRMNKANINDMLEGSYHAIKSDDYYLHKVRYPKYGGYQAFISTLLEHTPIKLNHKLIRIDSTRKKLYFTNGTTAHYDTLISSMPMPLLIACLSNVPDDVKACAKRLIATRAKLVSFCFNRADIGKHLWFYIYDEDFLPARAYSPHQKSPYNVPKGCSALQFEVYHSIHKPLTMSDDLLIEHIIDKATKAHIFTPQDVIAVDVKRVDYANVIFYRGMLDDRAKIRAYLDTLSIKSIGRFGEWDYLWSHQSFLSGEQMAQHLSRPQRRH